MNGIKVSRMDPATGPMPVYSRRDFYTISLLTGPRQLQCADQDIELDGTCLFFGSLRKDVLAARQTGYACRFTEAFFKKSNAAVSPEQWALVQGHATHAFPLRTEQAAYLTGLFQKMLAEQQTPYPYRHELLRSYLQLVMHEALRLRNPPPRRWFRYYHQLSGEAGKLSSNWRSRQHRPERPA